MTIVMCLSVVNTTNLIARFQYFHGSIEFNRQQFHIGFRNGFQLLAPELPAEHLQNSRAHFLQLVERFAVYELLL